MASAVVMYSTRVCPYCVRAKMLLQKRGIPFDEIDVSNDEEKRTWLRQVTGRRTVPQIFIHGQSIGGSDELHALDRAGELQRMLSKSPAA